VFTTGVGAISDTTERQSQDEKYEWSHKHQSPDYGNYAQNGYNLVGEDHAIPQWVTDGDIALYGHDCQHHRLQASAHVDGVHLCDAVPKHDLPETEPENT
jgi:hypothetical protein